MARALAQREDGRGRGCVGKRHGSCWLLLQMILTLAPTERTDPVPLILIVDDEPDFASALATLLTDEGYETECCTAPSEALTCVERFDPDLLILDLLMPAISGWEVLTALRTMGGRARLPVIIMTSGVAEGRAEYRRRHPPHTLFQPKPLDFDLLLFNVEMLLHPNLPPPRPR